MSSHSGSESVDITVKYAGKYLPINIHLDSSIKDLKIVLQQITDLVPGRQKLITRGKVLVDESSSIEQSGLTNGATVMLIACHGVHPRIARGFKPEDSNSVDESTYTSWKLTRTIDLSKSNFIKIPLEVWECGCSIHLLDVTNNFINEIPSDISNLTSLVTLQLDFNNLSTESVHWAALACLRHLTTFSATDNKFTEISSEITKMTSLKNLILSNNTLISLPSDIGFLTQLELLSVSSNSIASLPESIGNCTSLLELDASENRLTSLPDSVTKLENLRKRWVEESTECVVQDVPESPPFIYSTYPYHI